MLPVIGERLNLTDRTLLNGFPRNPATGFVNVEASTFSYDDPTRTFTMSPVGDNFEIWRKGIKHTISSPMSVEVPTNVAYEGIHTILFDGVGLRTVYVSLYPPTGEFADFGEDIPISSIYWDSTAQKVIYLGEERAPIGVERTTIIRTDNRNMEWYGGSKLNSFTIGTGSTDIDAQFSIEAGIFLSLFTPFSFSTLVSDATCDVGYILGPEATPLLRRGTPITGFKVMNAGTGRLAFNTISAGNYVIQEATNNYYVNYHYFSWSEYAKNYVAVMGQSEYSAISDAREGALYEMKDIKRTFRLDQFGAIGTIIFQTNNTYGNQVKSKVVQANASIGLNYIDYRGE